MAKQQDSIPADVHVRIGKVAEMYTNHRMADEAATIEGALEQSEFANSVYAESARAALEGAEILVRSAIRQSANDKSENGRTT